MVQQRQERQGERQSAAGAVHEEARASIYTDFRLRQSAAAAAPPASSAAQDQFPNTGQSPEIKAPPPGCPPPPATPSGVTHPVAPKTPPLHAENKPAAQRQADDLDIRFRDLVGNQDCDLEAEARLRELGLDRWKTPEVCERERLAALHAAQYAGSQAESIPDHWKTKYSGRGVTTAQVI